MSSPISSSDNSAPYLDYRKQVDELEEDHESQTRKQRQDHANTVNGLHDKQSKSLKRVEDQWKRTAENIREEGSTTLSRERSQNKLNDEKLRAELYDRYGRNRSAELSDQGRELNRAQDAVSAEIEASRARERQATEAYEKRLVEMREETERELEQAVTAAKSGSGDSEEAKKARLELERAREAELYKRVDSRQRQLMLDAQAQDRKTQKLAESVEHSAENRIKNTETYEAARRAELQKAYAQEIETNTHRLRDSHQDETMTYREQLQKLNDHQKRYLADKADGRADAIKEFSGEVRSNEKMMTEVFNRDLENYRRAMKSNDAYLNHLNSQNLRDKDAYYANVLNRQNQEHHDTEQDLQAVFGKNRELMDTQLKREKQQSERSRETLAAKLNSDSTRALQDQAETYRSTLARHSREKNSEIQRLQGEVTTRSTSDDISLVPTAAEDKLRNQIASQFEKRASAHEKRDNIAREKMNESFATNTQAILAEQQGLRGNAERNNALTRQHERNQLLGTIADTELQKKTTLGEQEAMHQRFVQRLERNSFLMLDKQRRDYEEVLAATRHEAQLSKQTMRQELEFQSQMNQRAFSQKQNELIRDYEKRLSTQKADYDALLQATKEDADRKVREAETRGKQQFEAQTRAQEQRIAQLEMQGTERERTISRNYEDEIEKLKRSHALRQKS